MIPNTPVAASVEPFILSILTAGESTGYETIQQMRDVTNGQIEWTIGTLNPLLRSLVDKGPLKAIEREASVGAPS